MTIEITILDERGNPRPKQTEIVSSEWLVYVKGEDGIPIMIGVVTSTDLRTEKDVLSAFAHVKGAYATPVED